MHADEGSAEVRLGHRECKRGKVERGRDLMKGGRHNSSPLSISIHADESGHRIPF